MPQLVITHPSHEERRIELTDDEYVLGRDPHVAIPLRDRKVSRRHARIFRRGGSYFIEDLGSVNGVLLGGQSITGPRKMNPGVELDVGGFGVKLLSDRAREAVTFTLTGRTTPVLDQVFMLPVGELEVGRVDGAAIVIPDVSVSRTHALLTVDTQSVIVEDLSSSNGTYVNGVKVGRRELKTGDVVRFGNIDFKFGRAGTMSLARARQIWASFTASDSTVKAAGAIGTLAAALLVTVIVFAIRMPPASKEGVSAAEGAYGRMIEDALLHGHDEIARAHWKDAEKAFDAVLGSDPINFAARDGRATVDQERQAASDLDQARSVLNQSPRRALDLADSIPLRSASGREAAGVAASARTLLYNDAYTAAAKLCSERQYERCHNKVIESLRYKPESTAGKSLLGDAEYSMRTAKMKFTPWQPPSTPEEVALQARYPDSEVRDIVFAYMGGDVSTAIDKARSVSYRVRDSDANRLLNALVDLQRTRDAAEQAANAGEPVRVVRLLEHALAIDSTIMPAALSSTVNSNLTRKIGRELYTMGDYAMTRGYAQEAFHHWYRASQFSPNDELIVKSLGKLESQAAEMLYHIHGTDPAQCAQLQTIMTITRPDSSVYLAAKSKHNECR